jgi:predicted O-methyltransferase YrrM
MNAHSQSNSLPPLVQQAQTQADRAVFLSSCIPEVGRLLHVLTRHVSRGPVGELGTGYGVGAAWIASALPAGVSFFSVEIDAERVYGAQTLFAGLPQVQLVHGDWHDLLSYGPFELLFADVAGAKSHDPAAVVEALRPGGLLLLDDFTPEEYWPPEWQGHADPVRMFWLNEPRIVASEIRVTATSAVILATRL